jgi:hypothetical protein
VCAECIKMHIDRANEIAMASKSTGSTDPISSLGLVFMPTYRTPAAGSSFGAGEAHDVGLFMHFHTAIPDLPCFHLSLFEAMEEHRSKVIELIDANGFHMFLFFFFTQKIAIRGSLSSRPLERGGTSRSYVK